MRITRRRNLYGSMMLTFLTLLFKSLIEREGSILHIYTNLSMEKLAFVIGIWLYMFKRLCCDWLSHQITHNTNKIIKKKHEERLLLIDLSWVQTPTLDSNTINFYYLHCFNAMKKVFLLSRLIIYKYIMIDPFITRGW